MDDNKRKALSAALGQIEKQFGKGAIMRMGDVTATAVSDAISTGSLGLDVALGIGVDASSKSTVPSLRARPR